MQFSQQVEAAKQAITPSFMPNQDCLFVSGEKCFVSHGIKASINIPINNTKQLIAKLNTLFQQANDNDRVFGVLPFCKQQQAQFILPKQVTCWDKLAFTSWLNAEATATHKNAPNQLTHIDYLQDQAHFEQTVHKAKALFENNQLDKIVLSKQAKLHFAKPLDSVQVIGNLLQQNRSGYHFSIPTINDSVLVGVSPELLLGKSQQKIISNPLAGSIPRCSCPEEEAIRRAELFNSQKDRYEHAVVIDDMYQVLAPFCQDLNVPAEPELLSTATMWHLSTVIEGQLANPNTHILEVANRLHPTPALCGKPTAEAYKHILDWEGHSRGLFSGIVGWCDKQGNGEWVVVIRCGELFKQSATLFAGAGIVSASNPKAEWLETQAKLRTMLNALGVYQTYHSLSKSKQV